MEQDCDPSPVRFWNPSEGRRTEMIGVLVGDPNMRDVGEIIVWKPGFGEEFPAAVEYFPFEPGITHEANRA